MTTNKAVLTLILTMVLGNVTLAAEPAYPTSEEDIVSALALQGSAVYLTEKGKVCEVNGPRCEIDRNLGGIVDTANPAPRATAMIQFKINSATISRKSFGLLDNYARALQGGLADAKLQIGGHTDDEGDSEDNKQLAQFRADAVRDYLIGKGVAKHRLASVGFGEDRPIADNKTKSGRAKNRRVEFVRLLE